MHQLIKGIKRNIGLPLFGKCYFINICFPEKSFIPFSVDRDQLISQAGHVISWNDLLNAQNRSPLKPGEKKKKGGIEISDWKLACIKLYRPQWQNIHKVPLLQLLITSKLFSLFTVIQAMKIDGRGKSNRGRWGFKGNMNNSSLPRHLVGMHKFNENSIFDKKWKIKQIQFAAKDRGWTLMNNSWTWKVELLQMHLFIQSNFDSWKDQIKLVSIWKVSHWWKIHLPPKIKNWVAMWIQKWNLSSCHPL